MTRPPRPTTRRAKDPVPTRRSAAPRKTPAKPKPEAAKPAKSNRKLLFALGGGLAAGAIALTGLIARRRIAAWMWRDGDGDAFE